METEFSTQNPNTQDSTSLLKDIQYKDSHPRKSETPEMVHTRRKTIAIRRSSVGHQILTFTHENSDIQLPKVEPKRRGLLRNFFRSQKEEKTVVPQEPSRDHLDKVLFKAGYDLRAELLHDLLVNDVSDRVLEYMFLTMTYTIDNYFGIPGPTSDAPHKLSAHLNRLIPLKGEVKQRHFQKLKKVRAPPYVLDLKVIEAKDLISTDANGLSDPFCKVYLNEDKSEAKWTEVRDLTLNPVWNETFRFHLKDFRKDVVRIEMWDSDPIGIAANLEQIKQVQSLRGCWLFCQDLFESLLACGSGSVDDFMGQNGLDVGKLYAEGVDEWLPLKTEKGKDHQGELHVSAKVEVIRPEDTLAALKRHFVLVKLCLEYGVKTTDDSKTRITQWQQILNQSSKTLLFQHVIQGSIYVFEDLICKFVMVVHLAQTGVAFDFRFIFAIFTETKESIDQFQSVDYVLNSPLQDVYQKAILQLQDLCLDVVRELHTYDISEDAEKRIEVEFVLRCVNLCENITDTSSELWPILKSDAESWFGEQAFKISSLTPENRADGIVRILKTLKGHLIALDKVFKSVFPDTSYTNATYKSLESMLCRPLKLQVVEIARDSIQSGNDTRTKKKEEAVRLFGTLKELSDYVSRTLTPPSSVTELGQFHEWFGVETIKDWFAWKEDMVVAQIQFIAKEDDLENKMMEVGDRYEKQSLSVKKASDLIQKELCGLWNLVSAHADCKSFFVCSLHHCCMKYAYASLDLIHSKGLANAFHVGGRKQVGVIANNLWSLGMFAARTLSRAAVKLCRNHPYTKFCLQLLCVVLCRDLCTEVQDEVIARIRRVSEANTRLKQEEALREYTWYMQRVYRSEANRDLCLEVYVLFQDYLWMRVLSEVSRLKDVVQQQRRTCLDWIRWYWGSASNKLEGLQKLLRETEKLNYYDPNGKLRPVKWNEEFRALKTELDQLVDSNR